MSALAIAAEPRMSEAELIEGEHALIAIEHRLDEWAEMRRAKLVKRRAQGDRTKEETLAWNAFIQYVDGRRRAIATLRALIERERRRNG